MKKKIDTNFMEIVFEGTILPKSITLYKNPIFVKRPNNPIKFCHKCLYFGHIEKWCKSSNNRCKKCSSKDHSTADCDNEAYCLHCKTNDHSPNTEACKETLKQKNINDLMWTNNISFAEARRVYYGSDTLQSSTFNQDPNEFPNLPKRNSESIETVIRSPPTKLTKGEFSQVTQKATTSSNKNQSQSIDPYPRELMYRASQYPANPVISIDSNRSSSKRKLSKPEYLSSYDSQSEGFMVPLRRSVDSLASSTSCGSKVATLFDNLLPILSQIFEHFKKDDLDFQKKNSIKNNLQLFINSLE